MKSHLDKELAGALAEASDGSDEPVVKATPQPPRPPSKGSRGLLIALVAMGAAIVALVLVGMQSASMYSMRVDQVVAQSGELEGRRLRVDGVLVPGTLVKRDKPCEYRFVMHADDKLVAGEKVLNVRYAKCEIPDTFRDRPEGGVMVTVEGTLASRELFEATNVFAKCSSKYDPETHELTLPDGTKAKTGGAPSAAPAVPSGYDAEHIIR